METLPNIHPGEILVEEFMLPLKISKKQIARDLKIPANNINNLTGGKLNITAATAIKLSHYFGTSAKFWLGLQNDFDLEEQQKLLINELKEIPKISLHA